MFRKASVADVENIAELYDAIHSEAEAGRAVTGWIRDVYPTEETARAAISRGDMFVEEAQGRIVAAARINQEQVDVYADAAWDHDAPPEQVMVLHTLVVSPREKGLGYGSRFVAFYEQYALEQGCPYLRMDTNAKNLAARALYRKLGYKEVSVLPCKFNGIPDVALVCLEKKLLLD